MMYSFQGKTKFYPLQIRHANFHRFIAYHKRIKNEKEIFCVEPKFFVFCRYWRKDLCNTMILKKSWDEKPGRVCQFLSYLEEIDILIFCVNTVCPGRCIIPNRKKFHIQYGNGKMFSQYRNDFFIAKVRFFNHATFLNRWTNSIQQNQLSVGDKAILSPAWSRYTLRNERSGLLDQRLSTKSP